jgi:hypothetical protein
LPNRRSPQGVPARRRAQRAAHALGLGLGVPAQRDVAQDHGVQAPAALESLRDRGLDRELLAVGAQRPQRRDIAHPAAGDPGAAEMLDVGAVRGAEALRDEALERAADRLVARAAQQLLGRAVEEHDVLPLVHRDDGVHGRVDDRAEARLRRLGALVGDQHLARGDQDAHADHQHVGDDHGAEQPRRLRSPEERDDVGAEQRDERRHARAEDGGVAEEALFD